MVLKVWNRKTKGYTYIGGVTKLDRHGESTFQIKHVRIDAEEEDSAVRVALFKMDAGESHEITEETESMFDCEDGMTCEYVVLTLCSGSQLGVCFLDAAYLLNENGKTLDKL